MAQEPTNQPLNIAAVLSTVELMKNTFRHFAEAEQVLQALGNVEQLVSQRKEVLRDTNARVDVQEARAKELQASIGELEVKEHDAAQRALQAQRANKEAEAKLAEVAAGLDQKLTELKRGFVEKFRAEEERLARTKAENDQAILARKRELEQEIVALEKKRDSVKASVKAAVEKALSE